MNGLDIQVTKDSLQPTAPKLELDENDNNKKYAGSQTPSAKLSSVVESDVHQKQLQVGSWFLGLEIPYNSVVCPYVTMSVPNSGDYSK